MTAAGYGLGWALLSVLFPEQWSKREHRPAGVSGLACTMASLAVFGPDRRNPAEGA